MSLVSKGANLNHVNNMGSTFLYYAINRGKSISVRYAVQHGVDVNQPVSTRDTPLTFSVERDIWVL